MSLCHVTIYPWLNHNVYFSSCASDTETLIEHRASIEPEDGRVSPDGLLRVSAGLKNIEDIKKDLSQAIEIAGNVANKAV